MPSAEANREETDTHTHTHTHTHTQYFDIISKLITEVQEYFKMLTLLVNELLKYKSTSKQSDDSSRDGGLSFISLNRGSQVSDGA